MRDRTNQTVRRIVIVGTGTGVGKTWLGCELLRSLRDSGHRAIGLKPIESGVTPDTTTDAEQLASAGHPLRPSKPGAPAPYRFPDPISPHLAARRAAATVDLEQILTYVRYHESSDRDDPPDICVIETAGGLFSPLGPNLTNADLATRLDPARWLLVAPDALGVLHDVTATLFACRARGREPDGIALCRARPADASTGTNADEIARLRIAERPFVFPTDGARGLTALAEKLLASGP